MSLERLTGATLTPIATTTLAADGTYTFTTPALTGGTQLRTVAGTEVSPTLEIPVAPKVVAKKKKGVKLTLTVTVTPKAGGKANLERINLDTFKWSRVKQFKRRRQRQGDREGAEGRQVPRDAAGRQGPRPGELRCRHFK